MGRTPRDLPAVAVTGTTGFVGSRAASVLGEAGRSVVPIRRAGSRLGAESSDVIVDPGDPQSLGEILARRGVTVVVHLATHFVAHHRPSDVAPLIESNVDFATRVVEAARIAQCDRFVNASTAWQHLGGAEYAPVSLYAATKQAFEDILRYYADNTPLEVTNLTLFDTYGPDDRRRKLIPMLLAAEASGERVPMSSGKQLIDLVHVDDVARALHLAVNGSNLSGRWVISSGRPTPVREVVDLFIHARNSTLRVEFGAIPDRPNEMREQWIIGDALPGWQPTVRLVDGLAALPRAGGRPPSGAQ